MMETVKARSVVSRCEFEVDPRGSVQKILQFEQQLVNFLRALVRHQTLTRLAALHDGDPFIEPYRIWIEVRHPPATVDVGEGISLVDPRGRSYTRAELVDAIRRFISDDLIDAILIDGRNWCDLDDGSSYE